MFLLNSEWAYSLWYDGTRYVRLIRNFRIGTSLSNRIRIGNSYSNSNREFLFEFESNFEASQVPTLNLILILALFPNPNPNRNPTVITDPQIGPIDPQIVTVQIRPADPLRSAFCRVPS